MKALKAIAIASSIQALVLLGFAIAAESAARLSEETGQVLRNMAAVTMPGTLLAATTLRKASRFMSRWRRLP